MPAIYPDHNIKSMVSSSKSQAIIPVTKEERETVAYLRNNGVFVWDGIMPKNHSDLQLKRVTRGSLVAHQGHPPRIDAAGNPVGVGSDWYYWIEEVNVFVRTKHMFEKFCAAYADEQLKNVIREEDESRADYEARMLLVWRRNAIRRCFDQLARVKGKTLVGLERDKVIYTVAGRL